MYKNFFRILVVLSILFIIALLLGFYLFSVELFKMIIEVIKTSM